MSHILVLISIYQRLHSIQIYLKKMSISFLFIILISLFVFGFISLYLFIHFFVINYFCFNPILSNFNFFSFIQLILDLITFLNNILLNQFVIFIKTFFIVQGNITTKQMDLSIYCLSIYNLISQHRLVLNCLVVFSILPFIVKLCGISHQWIRQPKIRIWLVKNYFTKSISNL